MTSSLGQYLYAVSSVQPVLASGPLIDQIQLWFIQLIFFCSTLNDSGQFLSYSV